MSHKLNKIENMDLKAFQMVFTIIRKTYVYVNNLHLYQCITTLPYAIKLLAVYHIKYNLDYFKFLLKLRAP